MFKAVVGGGGAEDGLSARSRPWGAAMRAVGAKEEPVVGKCGNPVERVARNSLGVCAQVGVDFVNPSLRFASLEGERRTMGNCASGEADAPVTGGCSDS